MRIFGRQRKIAALFANLRTKQAKSRSTRFSAVSRGDFSCFAWQSVIFLTTLALRSYLPSRGTAIGKSGSTKLRHIVQIKSNRGKSATSTFLSTRLAKETWYFINFEESRKVRVKRTILIISRTIDRELYFETAILWKMENLAYHVSYMYPLNIMS